VLESPKSKTARLTGRSIVWLARKLRPGRINARNIKAQPAEIRIDTRDAEWN
jgi:hypothetical protein